jgi:hypothetical protein
MLVDDDSNIHIVLDRRDEIIYRKYDSLFNPLSEFKSFNYTIEAANPKFKIRNNYMVTVWTDSRLQMFFSTEIMGNISNVNDDELNPVNFLVNQEYYDAIRGGDDISFIDDTTFFVIWSGNGPYTIANSGIYGRIFSISGEPLTPDILIIDRYNDTTRAILGRIFYSKKSNKLITSWVSDYSGKYQLWGRLFNTDGTPADSSFLISDDPLMTEMYDYDLAMDGEENFIAVWAAEKDSVWELQWRWYNPYMEPLTDFKIISSSEDSVVSYSSISIDLSKEGKAVIVWTKEGEIGLKKYAKRFSSNGSEIGSSFRISENDLTYESNTILKLNNYKIICIWIASSKDWWYGIFGKIIDFNNPTSIYEDQNIKELPNSFSLRQNYPNPFNSITKIKYIVPAGVNGEVLNIKLKVYDILGNEIAILVDKKQPEGEYEIEFNAGDFSSGVYISILQGGDFIETNKMVLLK